MSTDHLGWVSTESLGWVSMEYLGGEHGVLGRVSTEFLGTEFLRGWARSTWVGKNGVLVMGEHGVLGIRSTCGEHGAPAL